MHLVAMQCVLVFTGFLGGGGGDEGQALTISKDQDATNPPVEYLEVTEGDALTMNCIVLENYWQHNVHWGKSGAHNTNVWLTQNSVVETNDPRVSANTFRRYYYFNNYKYLWPSILCGVTWPGKVTHTARGYVNVSVRNFPKEQPVCSTNQTANSTSDSVYLWCDTMKGYPGVNVTWTVDGTGDDDMANSSVVDYLDSAERERVRTELRLISTFWGNHWTKEFVCTVTSSAFPGSERTCSVNVTVERHVTTEANFDGNVDSTGILPPDSSSKGADNKLAIALVIPALFIALFTLLICVLKRKRQRKSRRGRNTLFDLSSVVAPNAGDL